MISVVILFSDIYGLSSIIASLNERSKSIETHFKEEFKDIKSRLQALDNDRIELASVVGCKGSEWYGTEVDFAMKRFLEYTGSLCDSPPASFPGSPVQRSSEDCDELDTQQALPDTSVSRRVNDNNSTVPITGKKNMGLFSETNPPALGICSFNPDLLTVEGRMPKWMEDLISGPKDTFIDSDGGDQSSTHNASYPKFCREVMNHNKKAQIPTVYDDLTTLGLKGIHSTSGLDAARVLWLVATRKDPQLKIGHIDMSCSFVVCDITLEDCPIVFVSDSFQTLTGYSRREALCRNCRFLQSPEGEVYRGFPRHFADGVAVYSLKKNVHKRRETQISIVNYRNGRQPFLNHLSIIPIPWDKDEIRYYVGFQTDLVKIVPRGLWT
ncbi:unnamed protein product [Fusarium fujikuroi]|nr:unnamed protein product [Fusarium fujikuroi]